MYLDHNIRKLSYRMPESQRRPNLKTNSFPLGNSVGDSDIQKVFKNSS